MKLLRTFLLVATAMVAAACAASAMPMASLGIVDSQNIRQVQVVCDEYGRCFRTERRYGRGYINEVGCPYGYTVQGGECRPYTGPVGPPARRYRSDGGYRNEVGCPYGYTVQGGVCKPYAGPVTRY